MHWQMKIIDSITSIFDKQASSCGREHDSWDIEETQEGAVFKKLTIKRNNTLWGIIHNDFYKGLSALTSDRSSFLLDKDCDGVALCKGEDKYDIYLVDLKSSFSEGNIDKAFKQDFFTLLKLHMMFSICEDYKINNFKIICYVACPPCVDTNAMDDIKHNIIMAEEYGDDRFINRCMKSYFYDGNNYSCQIKELPYIHKQQLHSDILNTLIEFRIYTPKYSTDVEGIIEL